jgi:predicted outer membrane repeat protein
MTFNGASNNVQHLVLTAYVKGLETLLPILRSAQTEVWGFKRQQRLFSIFGVVNVTLADSVIQGLAPLLVASPQSSPDETTLNPAVPASWNTNLTGETPADRAAREAKWACHMRIHNCTFSNTHLALVGQSSEDEKAERLIVPIVQAAGRVSMLSLQPPYWQDWPAHVEVANTTFSNIRTSTSPGSRIRLNMLRFITGGNTDTVTVRDSTFSNIHDASGDSLDLFQTAMVYSGRQLTKNFTMQRCQFVNITAALLAALEVREVTVDNCTVNGARLAYGGFAIMSQLDKSLPNDQQKAEIFNSAFSNITLGSPSDATALNLEYFTPGVGLLKTGSNAKLHVQGCRFRDVSLLPFPIGRQGSLDDKSQAGQVGAAFVRTAVIVAAADARVAQCSFQDCYTPAVVYAYSGEMETLGRVEQSGTANRAARDATVSITLQESTFVGNMYGVYADGFQVQVFQCSFTASKLFGLHVSGMPCLVVAGTALHDAAVSVERASNPGGIAFSMCNMGWFPLWLNGKVPDGDAEAPVTARPAALLQNMSGAMADNFDSAVSVYLESVNMSGVHGQPPLSLRDVHKASLQRVIVSGGVGRGAFEATSVSGLLMLQCRVENNSAELAVDGLNVAGGGTFTVVRSLYLLETAFVGNVGPAAGAMLLQSCGAVIINSCTYHNNTAGQSGGAVRAIASESMVVDTSKMQQPQNISCMASDVLGVSFEEFKTSQAVRNSEQVRSGCPSALLGGRATTFSSNVAGASGGAIAIEGLTLAAFNATRVNFWDNR